MYGHDPAEQAIWRMDIETKGAVAGQQVIRSGAAQDAMADQLVVLGTGQDDVSGSGEGQQGFDRDLIPVEDQRFHALAGNRDSDLSSLSCCVPACGVSDGVGEQIENRLLASKATVGKGSIVGSGPVAGRG